jgi:hypothetical protein
MSNTTENMLPGIPGPFDESHFNPGEQFMFGFKRADESVEEIIASDKKLLAELGITCEEMATLISELFASEDEIFRGYPVLRWQYIHSPVCPWQDFCTKSPFDFSESVTEIWLVEPEFYMRVMRQVNAKVKRLSLPQDTKKFVDRGWIKVFSDLHPHLLTEHQFLEGHETPYRIDPYFMKLLLVN